MWVSKKEYENLKHTITNYEAMLRHLTDKFKSVRLNKDRVLFDEGCILINLESFNDLITKESLNSDEVKNIKAELEWYKVKYHEMKIH